MANYGIPLIFGQFSCILLFDGFVIAACFLFKNMTTVSTLVWRTGSIPWDVIGAEDGLPFLCTEHTTYEPLLSMRCTSMGVGERKDELIPICPTTIVNGLFVTDSASLGYVVKCGLRCT
jgi:hypothetical protein